MQRPEAPGGAGLRPSSFKAVRPHKKATRSSRVAFFFLGPRRAGGNLLYSVLPLAGVPGAVEPEFETAALDSGIGMGLVLDEPVELLLVDGVDDVEGVEGVLEDEEGEDEDDGAAPVSSTFSRRRPAPAGRPGRRPLQQRV